SRAPTTGTPRRRLDKCILGFATRSHSSDASTMSCLGTDKLQRDSRTRLLLHSSTYCARASDNTIGCCPWGQTCNPSIAGGGAGGYTQQTSWVQPTTTWQQQPSTVYVTQGHATTTVVYAAGQGQQTTVYAGQGQGQQYCSTLYAHGGNLPTTEVGTCGTILIANQAGRSREMGRMVLVSAVSMTIGGIILGVRGWV
ncbi:unnamed protein product, partial [Aureobasidium pullulans]